MTNENNKISDNEVLANCLDSINDDAGSLMMGEHIPNFLDIVLERGQSKDLPRPTIDEVACELDEMEGAVNQLLSSIKQAKEVAHDMLNKQKHLTTNDLLAKYSRDFSTDVLGQLSVVDILRESVAELVSMMPEITALSEERKDQIEEQIVLFSLVIHDEAGNDNDRITE